MAGFKFSMKKGHKKKAEELPTPGGFNITMQEPTRNVSGPQSGSFFGAGLNNHPVSNMNANTPNLNANGNANTTNNMHNMNGVDHRHVAKLGSYSHITGTAPPGAQVQDVQKRNPSTVEHVPPHKQLTPSDPDYTVWKRIRLANSPFPRYRHVASSHITDQGKVYVIGGLHDQAVYGDTWILTASDIDKNGVIKSFKSSTIEITDNTPPPRVGHASTLCGNAFVVFGGDTHKVNKDGLMDDDLYLLNINSYKWTIPNPTGQRPLGRYGHKIVTIAGEQTRLYLLGGQFDDTYFGDLAMFDLSSFRRPDSHWVFLKPNGFTPPAITNHTMVTFDEKIWVFGGDTIEEGLINSVFMYDPKQNTWEVIETTGTVPPPMQEHAAIVYKDLMCIVGGKDAEDNYLNSVYFLNLKSLKWFRLPFYQTNIPQGRSGHSITLLKSDELLIMGGDKYDYASNQDDMHVSEVDNGMGTIIYTINLADLDKICLGVFDRTPPVNKSPKTPQNKDIDSKTTTPDISNHKPRIIHQEPQILTPYSRQEPTNTPNLHNQPNNFNTPQQQTVTEMRTPETSAKSQLGQITSESRKPQSPVPQITDNDNDNMGTIPTIARNGRNPSLSTENRVLSNTSIRDSDLDADDHADDEVGVAHIATSPVKKDIRVSSPEKEIDSTLMPEEGAEDLNLNHNDNSNIQNLSRQHTSNSDEVTPIPKDRNNLKSVAPSNPIPEENKSTELTQPETQLQEPIGIEKPANSVKNQVPISAINEMPPISSPIGTAGAAIGTAIGTAVGTVAGATKLATSGTTGVTKQSNMSREHFENLRDELAKIRQAAIEKADAADNHIKELEAEITRLKTDQSSRHQENLKKDEELKQLRKRYELLDSDYKEMEETVQEYEDILGGKLVDAEKFNDIIKRQTTRIENLEAQAIDNDEFLAMKNKCELLEKENNELKANLNNTHTQFNQSIIGYTNAIDDLLKQWKKSSKKNDVNTSPNLSKKTNSAKNRNLISKMNNRLDDLLIKSKELTDSKERLNSEYSELELKNKTIQSQVTDSGTDYKETAANISEALSESKKKMDDYKAHSRKLQEEIDKLKKTVEENGGDMNIDKQSEEGLRLEIANITAEKEELNKEISQLKSKMRNSEESSNLL
ncbi:Kel1p [Nakaseomyces bracarensis]|uniref:Kel1p n=1 Tax=Nakaseomyces bracarensis TaxID=273131 RepID=UPI003871331D